MAKNCDSIAHLLTKRDPRFYNKHESRLSRPHLFNAATVSMRAAFSHATRNLSDSQTQKKE